MPNPHEVAHLAVAGAEYFDWESVFVQHRWQEGWPTFRFTATEGGDLPFDWAKLNFKPGDVCTIILAGKLGLTGIITQRQVAYAGSEHGVQLSGVGKQWGASTSSVPSDKGVNNCDGKTCEEIARSVVESVGGSILTVGTVNPMPFPVMQAQPGEPVFDFLDRVARMRNATLGSDHLGNLLLIGEHSSPVVQQLTEGENILKMQCVFSCELMYSKFKLLGQFGVQNDKEMRAASQNHIQMNGGLPGMERLKEYVTEHPNETEEEAKMRLTYEVLQSSGTQITINATVQGWLRDGGELWRTGDNVMIHSPMCPVHLMMKIRTATFTQDNKSGTTTLLECVLPWMLGEKNFELNDPREADRPVTATEPPQPPVQDDSWTYTRSDRGFERITPEGEDWKPE